MKRMVLKNLFSFLIVFALTVGTVATLSMVTSAKTETASEKYSQQVRENRDVQVTELSASIPEETVSPVEGVIAFAFILAIPTVVTVVVSRSRVNEKAGKSRTVRRYSPRADMAFQNRV